MSSTENAAREPSSTASEPTRADERIETEADTATELASGARDLKDQLVTRGRSVATAALSGARGGLREAERRLEDEEQRWEARAAEAALPDVLGKDPIDDLAIRIDRESDYWRTFAVRSLRPGAARNLAIAGAVLALGSGLALGTLGTLAAIFGSAGPGSSALVTAVGVAVCAVIACALGVVSERGRIHAAREALHRADQAERRLERVAAILALKTASAPKYVEALTRLERER
jgi:hypothetical protein